MDFPGEFLKKNFKPLPLEAENSMDLLDILPVEHLFL
jgi:hypothetical protein